MSDVKLVSIGISFENCEYAVVPVEMIDFMNLGKITDGCYLSSDGVISNYKTVGHLYIRFNEKFDSLQYSNHNFGYCGETCVKNRIIMFDDITSVTLVYSDVREQRFRVTYKEENKDLGARNILQKTYEEYGFCIEIGE